jgi:diguanylate cyclase (GGDEF)-like protein/PAS domain S-box-containing protein
VLLKVGAGGDRQKDVTAENLLATGLLFAIVVLAIASTRVVGRRAARTVDQVTALLERNEARFRAMVRDSNDIMAIVDPKGRLVYASPATERILGVEIEPLVGTDVFELIHPEDRDAARAAFQFTRETKDGGDRVEARLRCDDGTWRVVEAVATNLLDDPSVEGIVISARDITDRRRAEAELREAQERFRSAFEHAPIGMALISIDGRLFRVNRALVQIVGRGESELLASSLLDLCHVDDRDQCREQVRRLFTGATQGTQLEQRLLHHDGHPVWVSLSASLVRDVNDQPMYLVCQVEDIAERRASGEALAHQAVHDPLTGLPNRLHFVERLGRELANTEARRGRVAVLFLDLDRFKVVNDSLGHSAGDRLLVTVADRLSSLMGPSDVVARFGGDEFTILCHEVSSEETVELIAERIAAAIARPVVLIEGEVFVTASIGIALSGTGADTPETLLRDADVAMYHAKERGRDRAELFDAREHHRVVDDLRTGNALHRAIERGELRVHYQPMIDLTAGSLVGFEALIRWEHPERGLVPPMEFVPLAEETGLIVPLGVWALEQACRQAMRWHEAITAVTPDAPPLSMSVNLSPRQLAEPALPNDVARVLHDTGIPPAALWLEITESTLMRDAESALSALNALQALGLHLAVDDFGTGYSSLAYLERLPVEALKIDRSFTAGVGVRKDSTAIVGAVVGLAGALQLSTVAEGIETPAQLQQLRGLGCEVGQGFLFGPARPPEVYGADPRSMFRPARSATRAPSQAAPRGFHGHATVR